MKCHIDVVINVSDENRIKSIPELYERITGKDEVEIITKFAIAIVKIARQIREKEEIRRVNDDIPF